LPKADARHVAYHFSPQNPHRRFLRRPISVYSFGNDLLVPDGRSFLLNFSGFSHGDSVQEHSNEGFAAAPRGFAMAESTVQNCKTLTMGSIPTVASLLFVEHQMCRR
jgi:hypothetical protein